METNDETNNANARDSLKKSGRAWRNIGYTTVQSNRTVSCSVFQLNEHNMVKNPNWKKADQLAIYKRGRGVELWSTKKQLQLSGQGGRTWTRALRIQSPAP